MNAAGGLQFGDFTLDVAERVLLRGGRPVPLTPKAFDVLAALAARPGRLVTKDELLSEVWPDAFVEEGNLAYHVFAVRKALGENGGETFVETVPRRGYRFVVPVTAVGAGGGEGVLGRPAEAPPDEEAPQAVFDPVSHPDRRTTSARRTAMVWFTAGAASAAAVLVLLYTAPPAPSRVESRVEISTTIRLTESSAFAISPDGLHLGRGYRADVFRLAHDVRGLQGTIEDRAQPALARCIPRGASRAEAEKGAVT
jgi:DNA-binding winged helix-turn-helix (wHTH) protein